MGKILGGCYHDARNTQKPFWIKVVYHSDHHLQVFYDDNGTKWKQCFEAKDVDLPTGYYFGLSASTGDHPDDHDVLAFETYELNPPYKAPKHADHDMTYSEKLKAQHAHDHAEGMHDQDREKAAEKEYGGTHAGTTSAVANRHMEEIMHANHLIFGSLDKIHARLDAAKMGMNVQHDHLDKSNSYTLNAGSQHGREGSTYADEHHDMQSLLAKVADVAHEVTEVHETIAHHTAAENDYNIMSRISAIERQVDSLAKAVSLATENVRKHHGIIEEHVASGGGSGAGHFLRYLFIILTGQVLIAVGYASYQKYRTEGKKYI
ncbi:hypothetical protein GQ42DRAFT_11783 [Ramicandelaber brevisporus]|nr:hypothetical protein GQ42DRAFT_11783 [Ramicandelaber brevisporus]